MENDERVMFWGRREPFSGSVSTGKPESKWNGRPTQRRREMSEESRPAEGRAKFGSGPGPPSQRSLLPGPPPGGEAEERAGEKLGGPGSHSRPRRWGQMTMASRPSPAAGLIRSRSQLPDRMAGYVFVAERPPTLLCATEQIFVRIFAERPC